LNAITTMYLSGKATEGSYYSALKYSFEDYTKNKGIDAAVIVQPKRSEGGMPDMLLKGKNGIIGHVEVKDLPADLLETEKTKQLTLYRRVYPNLILTDLFTFILYREGKKICTATLANKNTLLIGRRIPKLDDIPSVEKLFDVFLNYSTPVTVTAKDLAIELAKRANQLSNIIKVEIAIKNPQLIQIYESLKSQILPSLTGSSFADMYAQTLTYGLFFAKVQAGSKEFNRINAYVYIPDNIPLLKRLFYIMQDPYLIDHLKYTLEDIVTVLNNADMPSVMKNLHTSSWCDDPVIHFYETFLAAYNPQERERLGVYYTPAPVVAYIMASVQEFLTNLFDKQDGLADRNITLLDPASGTLTFPIMGIRLCHDIYLKQGRAGAFPSLVREHILKNFFAFELLLAPYVIGHFKATISLQDLGCSINDERFKLFLTNALETKLPASQNTLFPEIGDEGKSASKVKEEPVFVIVGNPPYSVSSDNKSDFIEDLMKAYKVGLENERNIQPLSNDYIKFIRFANWKIAENSGKGIIGMITDNSYLDGLIHRTMRKKLLEDFDQIFILNLHGNSRSKEINPFGGKDENVFNIQQGVAIIFLIKNKLEKKVFYKDIWGERDYKYQWLLSHNAFNTDWSSLYPVSNDYWLYPKERADEYDKYQLLSEIMPFHRQGVKTHRDWLVTGFEKEEIMGRLNSLKNSAEDEIMRALQLSEHYRPSVAHAKKLILESNIDEERIIEFSYRPFDNRYLYYDTHLLDRPRPDLYKQLGNIFLVTRRNSRQWSGEWSFAYVTTKLLDIDMKGGVYAFPLVVNGKPNFSKQFLSWAYEQFGEDCVMENLLGYIYGILYCKKYREKYASSLRTCFPRIPITNNRLLFQKISTVGLELIELHLLRNKTIQPVAGFPEVGSDIIENVRYESANQQVFINEKQYFSKVSSDVWHYEIGGYKVAKRWLEQRSGRRLSYDEQLFFMTMISVIEKTIGLQKELDSMFPEVEKTLAIFTKINSQQLLNS